MLALTLATAIALHAEPTDVKLAPDAATAYRHVEARRDWGLGFKFFTAAGALGALGSGGGAVVFALRSSINQSNGFFEQAAADGSTRDALLITCGAAVGIAVISGVVAYLVDVWTERLLHDAR